MFWLTERILKAYRTNGFISVEIFGPQGVGKTTYSIKVAREVFKQLGYKDPWETALDHLYFDIKDSLELLVEAYVRNQRVPIIIFDDAGIWLEKYSWQKEELRYFARLYKLIRTLCTAVVFTTPSEADIMKNIREKAWYKVKITRNGKRYGIQQANANIYVYTIRVVNKQFKEVVEEKAEDHFNVHLPDKIYQRYLQKRREEGILPQLRSLVDAFPEVKEKLREKGIDLGEEKKEEGAREELFDSVAEE